MKIFISHSSVNNKIVKKVEEVIKNYSIECWVDYNQSEDGVGLNTKINEGFQDSTHFFLIWSADAKSSEWVTDERDLAMTPPHKTNIIRCIFLLDDTAPPLGFTTEQNRIDDTNVHSIVKDVIHDLSKIDTDSVDEFDEYLDLTFEEIKLDDTFYPFSTVLKSR